MNSIKSRKRSFIDQIRQIIVRAFDIRHIIEERIRYCIVIINVIFVLSNYSLIIFVMKTIEKLLSLTKMAGDFIYLFIQVSLP